MLPVLLNQRETERNPDKGRGKPSQRKRKSEKERQTESGTERHEGRKRVYKGSIIPVVFVVVPVCRVVEFERLIKARLVLSNPNSHSSLCHKCFIHCLSTWQQNQQNA